MWIEPILTLDLILKGLVIGAIASAPMGPVGVLTVQRTIKKGRWYGFVTGVGAAFSDILYALITGLGMSFVMDFVERGETMFYFKLFGSIMLILFGWWAYCSRPAHIRPVSTQRGTLAHNGLTGFLVTFSNPLIVFLFVVLFARFAFVVPGHPIEQSLGYVAVFCGALLWWFFLTRGIDHMRNRISIQTLHLFNRVLGVIVMAAGILGIIAAFYYNI